MATITTESVNGAVGAKEKAQQQHDEAEALSVAVHALIDACRVGTRVGTLELHAADGYVWRIEITHTPEATE